jgi:hypothetical protein
MRVESRPDAVLDSVLGFCLGGGVPAGQDSACLWPGIAREVGFFLVVAGLKIRAAKTVKRGVTDKVTSCR